MFKLKLNGFVIAIIHTRKAICPPWDSNKVSIWKERHHTIYISNEKQSTSFDYWAPHSSNEKEMLKDGLECLKNDMSCFENNDFDSNTFKALKVEKEKLKKIGFLKILEALDIDSI